MTDETSTAMAAETLYEAFRQTEQAPDPNKLLSPDTFRRDFMTAMQRVALFVVEQNGPLGNEQMHDLEHIFYLDPIAPPLDAAEHPDVEAALGFGYLSSSARLVDEANRPLGRPAGPSNNAVVQALGAIVRALLGADGSMDLSTLPGGNLVSQLAASVPSDPPVADPPSAEPAPVPPAEELPAPSPRPLFSVACPARLHEGETCVAVTTATLFQDKNVVRNIRYAGLSGRVGIVRGLSFRTGSYRLDRTYSPTRERIAAGTLCITDRRIIFLSDVRNLDLAYGHLLDTGTLPNEIRLSKANSGQFAFRSASTQAVEAFEQMSGTSPDNRIIRENWPSSSASPRLELRVVLGRLLGVALAIGIIVFCVKSL